MSIVATKREAEGRYKDDNSIFTNHRNHNLDH